MMAMEETTGGRIRRLREEKNMTGEALAQASMLSPAAISRIERGQRNPTRRTIRDIARALKVKEAEIVGDKGE